MFLLTVRKLPDDTQLYARYFTIQMHNFLDEVVRLLTLVERSCRNNNQGISWITCLFFHIWLQSQYKCQTGAHLEDNKKGCYRNSTEM